MESSLHPDWSDGGKYEKQTNKWYPFLSFIISRSVKTLSFT